MRFIESNRMNYKRIIIIGLFVIFFFGEIAITFSYKGESNRNTPKADITPLSHKLTNELSSNTATESIDSILKH